MTLFHMQIFPNKPESKPTLHTQPFYIRYEVLQWCFYKNEVTWRTERARLNKQRFQ